ncbi:MAG: hypothetical protein R2737_10390 [Candidatus Nanopelagicales bacterium]
MSGERSADLVARAAADGHTWLPGALVASVAGADDLADAIGAGLLVRVDVPGDAETAGVALPGVAEDEELLGDVLAALADEGRLAVVTGPAGAGRAEVVASLRTKAEAEGSTAVLLDDAERLGMPDVLAAAEDLDDALLLLAGDPAALVTGEGPGAVLRDVVAAAVCPVVAAPPDPGRPGPLRDLDAALRRGELVAPSADDRSLVVVPVADDAEAVLRVGQLVSSSIPRAFGVSGAEVAVLTPLRRGDAGAEALSAVLTPAGGGAGPDVRLVHEAVGSSWPAVVLVLPGSAAGVLSRALLVSALSCARRHLSVVDGTGSALGRAVAEVPDRVRRTRLAGLLAAAGRGDG